MTLTPEGKVKQKIDALLKKYDVWYFKPRGTVLGRSGIPDYVCCFRRQFLGIEAKAGNNRPTALQVQEMHNISSHGGVVVVVNENDLKNLENILKWMQDNLPKESGGVIERPLVSECKRQ